MNRNARTTSGNELKPASPARGLAFMAGALGLFYALISVVDPLL